MASVSVVGQHPGPHRLDSEPRLFFPKLTARSGRKSSLEKMKSCSLPGSVKKTEPVTGSAASLNPPASPVPQRGEPPGETEERQPAREGCAGQSARAPRSPVGHTQQRDSDCDTGGGERGTGRGGRGTGRGGRDTGKGTGRTETGLTVRVSDFNSNVECDSGQSTGGRRGSALKKTVLNAMGSASVSNGHHSRGPHSNRDMMPNGRRGSHPSSTGQQSALDPGSITGGGRGNVDRDETDGPPLDRLTQGRTGVVKLARTEPYRRKAWSIFPARAREDGDRDPRVRTEKGEGHRFGPRPVTQDWCDACSRQITAQALKCENCSYTCHLECEDQVQLDCNQRDRRPEETASPSSHCSTPPHHSKKNATTEEEEGGAKALSREEVRSRIEQYNSGNSDESMTLAADGSYTGFIKVHLRLSRPVTVPAHQKHVDAEEAGSGTAAAQDEAEPRASGDSSARTSFYLPQDCVKKLHLISTTTVTEVIQGLLKKYMVLDNPRKFALYRQTHRDGQDLFQKLPLSEHPLSLRLLAGPDPDQLTFVLKENETGDVEWHNFSVPELQNFLVILEKEEAERVRVVEQKYTAYRQKLQQALLQHDP